MRRLSTRQYAEALLDLTKVTPREKWNVLFDEFLKTLQKRRQLRLLPLVLDTLDDLERERQGIVAARVSTARTLSESDVTDIRKELAAAFGKQVEVESRVDKNLLGGIVVDVGDTRIDASVLRSIEQLRTRLRIA